MTKETRQKRIALGLCTECGNKRAGEKCTKRWCGPCAQKKRDAAKARHAAHPEKNRDYLKKRFDTRKADGLCIQCGKPRTGIGRTAASCARCAKKQRGVSAAYQQRQRNKRMGYTEGDGRQAKKYPVGRASTAKRDGKAWCLPLRLDTPSYDAIQVIRKRYRDAEYKAGREPLTHQNSRLMREIIHRYEHRNAAVAPREHRLLNDWIFHLSLDSRTRAIVERHAARTFNDNLSATLRAMIIECQGFRRAFTGRG